MKNYTQKILVAFGIILCGTANSQWTLMGGGISTGADFNDMAVIDSNIIYIGGVNGYLKKTTDGTNWAYAKSGLPSTFEIWSLHCTDANTCFASGKDETGWEAFWTTVDGGSSWQTAPVPQDGFGDIYFVNSSIGYASNNGYRVYKTVNSGNSWQEVSPLNQSIDVINELYFTSVDVGYIVGKIGAVNQYAKIMKTIDGGANWTNVYTSTTVNTQIFDITFINSNLGFAVGLNGEVLKTTDAGSNWTALDLGEGTSVAYISVDFANQYTGLIYAGGSSVRRTIDGGVNWVTETLPALGGKVSMPHKNKGFILSEISGQLNESSEQGDLLTDGIEELFSNNTVSIYPNPITNQFIVKMDSDVYSAELHLLDISGKEIKTMSLTGKETKFERGELLSGLYFYHITLENQIINAGKLVIE